MKYNKKCKLEEMSHISSSQDLARLIIQSSDVFIANSLAFRRAHREECPKLGKFMVPHKPYDTNIALRLYFHQHQNLLQAIAFFNYNAVVRTDYLEIGCG